MWSPHRCIINLNLNKNLSSQKIKTLIFWFEITKIIIVKTDASFINMYTHDVISDFKNTFKKFCWTQKLKCLKKLV